MSSHCYPKLVGYFAHKWVIKSGTVSLGSLVTPGIEVLRTGSYVRFSPHVPVRRARAYSWGLASVPLDLGARRTLTLLAGEGSFLQLESHQAP